ncbi:MAG: glutamate--cysteine ligase [Gammaproteobacteria bacterium]|nr:glutamate--cysteine ligase [Gammaproteobacteria bacterium]
MTQTFEARLAWLAGNPALLQGALRGIEKESLRVTPGGDIALTPHPRALGSALTHPTITTDYSEALLELITPPAAGLSETLQCLADTHIYVSQHIGDECLWATSMPCLVNDPKKIPIAWYGQSNIGMMKHVYRRGLDLRYGRVMQAIAGVHFNYSLPPGFWSAFQQREGDGAEPQRFISERYFGLIRNFQRFGWVIPYLFGASPAMCRSFFQGRNMGFDEFDDTTLYRPYATSLRMSDIGYKNNNQAALNISYNQVDAYVENLARAIETPDPAYQAFGVEVDGVYRQLNANILQIENEYYSFIRPKQITEPGEKPTTALRKRGVQYVEVRALDVSPFSPVGVSEPELRFVEAFLVYCLLEQSPAISAEEQQEIDANQSNVAVEGRRPDLALRRNGESVLLRSWANEIVSAVGAVSEFLDQAEGGQTYSDSVHFQAQAVADSALTPSARILAEMRAGGTGFFEFAMGKSRGYEQYFKSQVLEPEKRRRFEQAAAESLQQQVDLEQADHQSFQDFLQDYFARS